MLKLTFHFKAPFDRLANPLSDLVERSRPGVASRELRYGGDIVTFLIALNDDIELAWQRGFPLLYFPS
jgi:hypothetical protein